MPCINVLGIEISSNLGIGNHVNKLIKQTNKIMFTLQSMRSRGMGQQNINDIYNSLVNSRLFYCSSCWTLLASREDVGHLKKVVKKAIKWGYANPNTDGFMKTAEHYSDNLFKNVISNDDHALHHLLPEIKDTGHNTRQNRHNRILPQMMAPHDTQNFLNYQLYKHIKN